MRWWPGLSTGCVAVIDRNRSAALWTRLKCAGPCRSLADEFEYLAGWLPAYLRPLLLRVRHWRSLQATARQGAQRLALEKRALEDLQRTALACGAPAPVAGFLERLLAAHALTRQARLEALTGSVQNPQLEEQELDALDVWLERGKDAPLTERMVAGWLQRLLRCWRKERAGG